MKKVVIVGGGWAGSSAALAAAKAGADVVLLERMDALLGTGLVGGIMRNNGRFTAAEEMIALGGGDMFSCTDAVSRHKGIEFPDHKHASLYDIYKIEPLIKETLLEAGVDVRLQTPFSDVEMDGQRIKAVSTAGEDKEVFEGDVFIDTTGTCGPTRNCTKYGNGCVMCVIRCPSFGPRVSLAGKAGVAELVAKKKDGSLGAMSGSCKLQKDSLAPHIIEELDRTGVCVVPLPPEDYKGDVLDKKACQQYATKSFAENIILLDTGPAKLMSPYFALDKLRKISGFENARYEDPYSGGLGNSMRYFAMSPRTNELKVEGVDNLFCAGEKAGPLVGHTEAISTGTLAGYNAVRHAHGLELLTLPTDLAVGDAIAYVKEQMQTEEGIRLKYTFSGSVYFSRMKELGLYTTDIEAIQDRVAKAGLTGIFSKKASEYKTVVVD
ncbi:MAG: FAD-dependent oxidoreductase [Clostridia bacterium]|jgi:hypothetical protein|nr:FAD-dependent oxidoreductase [Clostridia bacterium]